MDPYQSFYQPSPELLALVQQIEQQGYQWSSRIRSLPAAQRQILQQRGLSASLSLDHNSLSLLQLQELAAGNRVVALLQDIEQAKNALALYTQLADFNPYQSKDLRRAHALLLASVSADAGLYRQHGAGVYEGHKLVHMPPAPSSVSALVERVLQSAQQAKSHPLIDACLVHFQLASIHPFAEGNGRLCRLWQQLVMAQWQPEFIYLPFIIQLKDKARDYHKCLRQAVPKYDATAFILFMLRCISDCLTLELARQQAELLLHCTEPVQGALDDLAEPELLLQKVKTKTPGPWYKTEDQILKKLKKDNRLSAKTIACELGLSSRAIEKQLAKLKAAGKLVRTGPAKGGHWQVLAR